MKESRDLIEAAWDTDIVRSLSDYIRIPALSPGFDAAWEEHGHLRAAVDHVADWVRTRALPDAVVEVVHLEGRSPVLLVEVPGTDECTDDENVLVYGHLDKQPAMGDWSEGLGPWNPVLRDGRLYGRGSVDDGYSGYLAVCALEALRASGGAHARTFLLLETAEESGSPGLPEYLAHFGERFGDVGLVICLDAGGGSDYERLHLTASLRGLLKATVTVRVLETPVHSGLASGVVPSSFRVMRQLLDRLEDSATGEVRVPEMHGAIPAERLADAAAAAAREPGGLAGRYPMVPGMTPASGDEVELILNSAWRPTLSVTGAAGLPEPGQAGEVLRTSTSLRLSFRLAPTADAEAARSALERTLTTDVPYGAQVEVGDYASAQGFSAPEASPWLARALDELTGPVFTEPCRRLALGGGIPFMELLGRTYPRAEFLVTGALVAENNMHVPDEWLNIDFAKQVTAAVARVLDAHARR
ncbi:M20/M25/M40 family metallo-hydrolase [Streptomyces fuscigenes]|uniref:M20/M25/M40 family metallo-hydrolase n=1 Tax=Streptomyces fuscigenes TaxID=1528880 RepID=UPI001F2F264C|nr:M20/M25/M40 family metallo-hydrolase [Streptomyces fuscigenes]MCF3961226.1 M20/M25/M40 family metallo-hydrolase [Streptomyces fuscigenes]